MLWDIKLTAKSQLLENANQKEKKKTLKLCHKM